MKLYTFFNFTSIAGTEKRPLSYKTPQSFHRPRYCGVQTFPLEMHYVGEKLGENWGRSGRILTPNERVLTVGVPVYGVVSSKLSGICNRRRGDRQKDRHTDTSDFIICPMLCYSNGTDYKQFTSFSVGKSFISTDFYISLMVIIWIRNGQIPTVSRSTIFSKLADSCRALGSVTYCFICYFCMQLISE